MANLEKKEIIDKISEKVTDSDLQMELLEDITDSFDKKDETVSKKDYDRLQTDLELMKTKYDDLKNKYISRFSEVDTYKAPKVENEEIEEKQVIDVRSIFD